MLNWIAKLLKPRDLQKQENPPVALAAELQLRRNESAALKRNGDERLDAADWQGAAAFYQQAIAIDGNFGDAYSNLGLALMELGRLDEAENCVRQATALNPASFNACYLLGSIAQQLGKPGDAVQYFTQAVTINPAFSEAYNCIGNLWVELGDRGQAALAYQRALALNPSSAEYNYNFAEILAIQGKRSEAIAYYRRALELSPSFNSARINLIHQMQQICDWKNLDANIELVRRHIREAPFDPDSRDSPFSFLAFPGTTADEQRLCAERWTRSNYVGQMQLRGSLGFVFDSKPASKIKIAYLSADFHTHATAMLLAEVFELHDRERFHITAYSYGANDSSGMRARLENAFDEFVDIEKESIVDSARRIYQDRIDILVDLKGYTGDSRSAILALRPARIQVNFLGYPGTMGADFVDYLIADRYVVPPACAAYYSENIAYLPDCYQPNDRKRSMPDAPSRSSQQLPDQQIVFCCFNQTYKITPEIFSIWCRLLSVVPGSVLWLLSNTPESEQNLRKEAAMHGVSEGRLFFAPRVPIDAHLARLQCADLFLDTHPYNAHTTCSEALWMGLPVVTCPGDTFASRVAGSLLSALEMPELIAADLNGYFELAMSLATDDVRRHAIRDKIKAKSRTAALFDSARFTRNLESCYISMLENEENAKLDFQVVIVSPINYPHSQAFTEIAETLLYGLKKMGLKSSIGRNAYSRTGRNIILGSNLLTPEEIAGIPADSIIYNLEQIYSGSPWVTQNLMNIFGKFEVWDYSQRNVDSIRALVQGVNIKYVPVGYVTELTRIPPADEEDIDILFYGSINERRKKILDGLTARGIKVTAVFGVYGEPRDALISRAKLVLNMRLYESDIFEIVRVSYLLSNQKAVVSECNDATDMEADLRDAMALAPYAGLIDACLKLLGDPESRKSIARNGFDLMSKRSEESYLRGALAQ